MWVTDYPTCEAQLPKVQLVQYALLIRWREEDVTRLSSQVRTTPDYDDANGTSTVTPPCFRNLKAIPDLPSPRLPRIPDAARPSEGAAVPPPETASTREDWTRWNDYGIGSSYRAI